MSATHVIDSTTATAPVLYLAFELGWTSWKLAFTIGAGQKPREGSRGIKGVRSRFGFSAPDPFPGAPFPGADPFPGVQA